MLGVWEALPLLPRLPLPACTPWDWGGAEGATQVTRKPAQLVSAPGGEETPEADLGGGQSQVALGCQVNGAESREVRCHVQDLGSEQEPDRHTAGAAAPTQGR